MSKLVDEKLDNDVEEDVQDELDQFESAMQRKEPTVWSVEGRTKDLIVSKVIKYFGSLIVRHEIENADAVAEASYKLEKSPNASLNVLRARVLLRNNENFETRDFTIFISKRKWVKTQLCPLMELCVDAQLEAEADRDLAMRCCKLVMVLIKKMKDQPMKALKQIKLGKTTSSKQYAPITSAARANATAQLSALLSFKEALCTEKCVRAVTMIFAEALRHESVASRETSKEDMATCFSYLRRMLAIEAMPSVSPPGELLAAAGVHHRFVYHSRVRSMKTWPMYDYGIFNLDLCIAILSSLPSICADIMNRYHDDWLADILLIVHFVLRVHKASDLFATWKANKLMTMEELQHTESIPLHSRTALFASRREEQLQHIPSISGAEINTRALKSNRLISNCISAPGCGKGVLSRLLQSEKCTTVKLNSTTSQRRNRFAGVYHFNTATAPSQSTSGAIGLQMSNITDNTVTTRLQSTAPSNHLVSTDDLITSGAQNEGTKEPADRKPSLLHKRLVRDPFATGQNNALLTGHLKRTRKNLVFAARDPYEDAVQFCSKDIDGKRACIVAATMSNFICESAGLAQLVRRVNEDLRRGEGHVGSELELVFFQILSKLLHYQRLKINQQKSDFDVAGATDSYGNKLKWVPNMENTIHALDKMTFTRTTTAIQKLITEKRYNDILIPMASLKEMICYLRLLLESSDLDHNEIAVAALYRLFYTRSPSERLDLLPKLLSEWKLGVYSKTHLECLVELVHESLKALDSARAKFSSIQTESDETNRKKRKKLKNSDMDIHQYMSVCVSFSVHEYFRRVVVSQHTISMYTALLSKYSTNEPATNHYIFKFFERLAEFKLEQSHTTLSLTCNATAFQVSRTSSHYIDKVFQTQEPHLGFLLFNISTMVAFNKLLNDANAYKNRALTSLITLGKAVTRRFFQSAEKNHMLFVESLLRHSHATEMCIKIDNIYEAQAFRLIPSEGSPNGTTTDRIDSADSDDDDVKALNSNHHKFSDSESVTKLQDSPVSPSHSQSHAEDRNAALKSATITAADYGDEMDENDAMFTTAVAPKQPKRRDHRDGPGGQLRKRLTSTRMKWAKEEDEIIRSEYPLYADSASVYDVIANSIVSREGAREVTVAQVRLRVKALKLVDQDKWSADASSPKAKKKRVLRKKSADFDSDSDSENDKHINSCSNHSNQSGGDNDSQKNAYRDKDDESSATHRDKSGSVWDSNSVDDESDDGLAALRNYSKHVEEEEQTLYSGIAGLVDKDSSFKPQPSASCSTRGSLGVDLNLPDLDTLLDSVLDDEPLAAASQTVLADDGNNKDAEAVRFRAKPTKMNKILVSNKLAAVKSVGADISDSLSRRLAVAEWNFDDDNNDNEATTQRLRKISSSSKKEGHDDKHNPKTRKILQKNMARESDGTDSDPDLTLTSKLSSTNSQQNGVHVDKESLEVLQKKASRQRQIDSDSDGDEK